MVLLDNGGSVRGNVEIAPIVSRAARASEPSPLAISIDRVSSVRVLREIGLSPTWTWPTGRFRSLVG